MVTTLQTIGLIIFAALLVRLAALGWLNWVLNKSTEYED